MCARARACDKDKNVLNFFCFSMGEQLRQICKLSGASVSFGTANVRDSFYRASVDFVLSICSRCFFIVFPSSFDSSVHLVFLQVNSAINSFPMC